MVFLIVEASLHNATLAEAEVLSLILIYKLCGVLWHVDELQSFLIEVKMQANKRLGSSENKASILHGMEG